mgnify:CR=1 FL=1
MFKSSNGDFDIQKNHINGKGEYVITAGIANCGILGKSDVAARVFSSNTITVDMFGNAFYRSFSYKMVTHARVFSIQPKFRISERQGLFFSNSFHFLTYYFGYQNMCSWAKIQNLKIQLPTKNGEIDFEFMGDFVAELEAQRVAELEAYLTVTGLSDYVLTEEEEKAIQDYLTVNWKEYLMGELFERVNTKKLPYKAKDLPKEPCGESILPALTSSFMNQGLNYYVPKDEATVLKNVISIPSNSDVYRAYFQSKDFTVLSDAYAIDWIYEDKELNPEQYLFTVPCINKVTDLPIYSYKNKLGGWNVVKKKNIELPTVDGNIDYNYMETLTKAIQKLVIKDVVDWTDKKVSVAKQVIKD